MLLLRLRRLYWNRLKMILPIMLLTQYTCQTINQNINTHFSCLSMIINLNKVCNTKKNECPETASLFMITTICTKKVQRVFPRLLTERSHVSVDMFSPCGLGMLSRWETIWWRSPFRLASKSRATIPGVPNKNRILPAQEERYDNA